MTKRRRFLFGGLLLVSAILGVHLRVAEADSKPATIFSNPMTATLAEQMLLDPQGLIDQWRIQNTLCRGGSGDQPDTQRACEKRQEIGRALDNLDWCYGTKDQMAYQMQWHQCRAESNRYE